MLNRDITIDYLLQVVRRRKLAIVLPATVITTGAIIFALLLPSIYQSDTVILVEPQQSVETTAGKPSITVSMERDRLATLSQQILSRSHLEQVINEFDLYGHGPMEQRVRNMRDGVQLDVVRPDQTGNIGGFKISYQNHDPRIAADVTNRLAALFINENTNSRERFSSERTRFLEEQSAQTKAKLDEQERRLQEFKQQHFDKLPDQRDANLKMIEQLNGQLAANNDALSRAEQQRVYFETMLAEYRVAPKSGPKTTGELPLVKVPTPVEKQLEELKGQLAELRNKYTEQHPDVIRAERRVEELEQKRAVEAASASATPHKVTKPQESEITPEAFTTLAQVTSQLQSVKAEIQERTAERSRLQHLLNGYQSRLELSPALEQEFATLTRDYNTAKENYETLSNEKLSSEMAQDLERKQKTTLFRVLDPAKAPEKPVKPNRRAIALFGLLAGLGAGLGLAFYREFTDESLLTEKDVETALGLEVLATIPQS